ncbi:alpha-tubulin N-acetyltransferase isoform X4 [Hermetia illucens]|uniref:alpha-tubulin N-acetyltransferase isoform X4 n=1 Tax=Hermetia illucens TaxID=343691 RepID=UPI0018CC0FF1|nr:alpha-tubulin N-acetyltransferase isoform X4 [Hermetia illucens]
MEFRFDLHPIFNQSIIKVNSNLLPVGFRGDRRLALDTATKMAEIINEMGSASARAQGLSNPVTTAQKLRMTDQNIYLLGDPNQGRNGAVVGLLKVGKKSLYVFDQNGQTQMVNAPCVLDFYVHESRQRSGLGRNLFDTMLQQEDFVPQKLAVDRPSDKLLGFLRKHYGLQKTIPQMNNFVVYDGFFEKPKPQENNVTNHDGRMHITASPNTALFGPQFINDEQNKRSKAQQNASNTSIPLIQNSPVGRYAAPRPMCSMAECLSTEEVDPSMNRLNPSASGLNKQTPSNVGINITNSVNTNANLHRPSSSNIMANNTNNPALNNIPRSSPSTTSMNRPSSSNTGLNKPAPSNTLINRERAAGLPSQNYNQHGDAPTSLNELSPQTQTPMQAPTQGVTQVPMQGLVQAQIQGPNKVPSQINMDVNPAEPIGKTNLATQEGKVQSEQPIYTEAPNDVLQEVCPHCATTFPSRSSTMKIVTSKVSLSNQQANVVNNQANDAIIHNTATPATGEPNREL